MAQTVIGLFDNADEAKQAVQQLLDNGFSTDNIDLSFHMAGGSTGSTTGLQPSETVGDSIGNFFGSLFGDIDQASTYSDLARQSGSIVTVHTQTVEEAQQAARILDQEGAIDLDQRAGFYSEFSNEAPSDADPETSSRATEEIPDGERPRSRIVDKPLEEPLRLRQENIYGDRKIVSDLADEWDAVSVREDTLEGSSSTTLDSFDADDATDTDTSDSTIPARTVTQLFRDWTSLENAYRFVRERGYDKDEVNVLMSDQTRERHFAHNHDTQLSEKVLEGAGAGSAIGGTLGAIAGAVAAIGTAVALPGLGLIVAGPLAAGLVGAGAGGLTGGLLGALVKAGVSEDHAKQYEAGIREGGVLLSVQAHSEAEARRIEQAWQGETSTHA